MEYDEIAIHASMAHYDAVQAAALAAHETAYRGDYAAWRWRKPPQIQEEG